MAYKLTFTPVNIRTREDYDAHMDQLDDLKVELWKEMNKADKIRKDLDLKKVRFGVRNS